MTLTEYDEAKVMEQFREEGMEEGIEIGREEGMEIGREEGMEIGREKGKLEIIRLMRQNNIELQDIAKATGIPVETIKAMLDKSI